MKKMLMVMAVILMSAACFAQKEDAKFNYAAEQGVTIVNDSTIIYYNTYKIVITEPSDVYTAIFRIPSREEFKKGIMPKLMIMSYGSYVFQTPDKTGGNFILYASRSFKSVVFRQTEYIEL